MSWHHGSTRYIDFDEVEYSETTLLLLRRMLDPFTIGVLKRIVRATKSEEGVTKSSLQDYIKNRTKYDTSFTILEYQGFIAKRSDVDGRAKPYFITKRGIQLAYLLQNEQREE